MNNDEEMHYWFTLTEFARLCEEYGLGQCLKDFTTSLYIWDSAPKDTSDAADVLASLEYLKRGVADVIVADNTHFGGDNG